MLQSFKIQFVALRRIFSRSFISVLFPYQIWEAYLITSTTQPAYAFNFVFTLDLVETFRLRKKYAFQAFVHKFSKLDFQLSLVNITHGVLFIFQEIENCKMIFTKIDASAKTAAIRWNPSLVQFNANISNSR